MLWSLSQMWTNRLLARGIYMTINDLDRLMSKTDLNPLSKSALRGVRRAIMSGRCGDAEIGSGSWAIEMDSLNGAPLRMRFSFKRDDR